MNTLIDTDWKKHAATATQSDQEIEKAFLDQAWMQVQNKATPLMKAQHRIGFEIVHKNDENTRMVGVFVFRVNKDYLFVPVFFINGSIKGTDLLYRANVKRFVPLNNEWCDYLVQLQTADEGMGVPMKMRSQIRDQVNLQDIVSPPNTGFGRGGRKYASVGDEPLIRTGITEMLEKLASIPEAPTDSVLRRFILTHGGHDAIRKIANTAKHDYEFARALMLGSNPDNYMPEIKVEAVKKASGPKLVVHTCVLRNDNVKKASTKITPKEMCQGYMIEDHRKEAEANDVVWADNTQDLDTVEAPGVYDALLADGSTSPCLVGFEFDVDLNNCPSPVSFQEDFDPARSNLSRLTLVVIDKGSRASDTVRPRDQQWVFGKYTGKLEDDDSFIALGEAKQGEGYRIYNSKTQGFSRPMWVKAIVDDPSGLKAIEFCTYSTSECCDKKVLINPDFEDYDAKDNIMGKSCKLVRVGFELEAKSEYGGSGQRIKWNCTLGLGNKHTLNAFIFENNFKTASVKMLPNGKFLVKSARTSQNWSQELSEPAAKIRLMLDCSLRESVTEELMKQASETKDPAVSFFYPVKEAHNLRFNDWPDFYDRMNNEFGVLEAPRSDYVLDVEEDKPIVEQHRVGDVWRQESDSNESLDTLNPMQLYGMSQEKGIGSLFEHGVVGELVKTYDAIAIVQSYIPDFEQALDRLGRIMFLFYWKPEDFAQAYGNDDQTSLENKLVSNFKSMGEMTLELLQKAKLQQAGTVSLT